MLTILLIVLSSTLVGVFQSLCKITCSGTHLALTWLVGIILDGLITCWAIPFHEALFIPTNNIFDLYSSFNLKAFIRQQLYEIWLYMGTFIICPWVYSPIYTLSNTSWPKVHLNIQIWMYGHLGPPFVAMNLIRSSQCLTSIYEAWSCLADIITLWLFDTRWITTVNIVFGHSWGLIHAVLSACSPKSVASHLLYYLSIFLVFWISLAQFSINISTHCSLIHSPFWKLSSGRQFLNNNTVSVTAVSQCRGTCQSRFKWFCPQIMDWCYFSKHPATNIFVHLFNTLQLANHIFSQIASRRNRFMFDLLMVTQYTAEICQIIAIIICFMCVVQNIRQWGYVCNSGDICSLQIHWQLESFRASVCNCSKLAVRFRIWVGTDPKPLRQVVPHEKTEPHQTHGCLAASTFSQTLNFASNWVFELWLYHNIIYT